MNSDSEEPDRPGYFMLDERREPRPCSYREWNSWKQSHYDDRIVAITHVVETIRVATFFFGEPGRMWERWVGPIDPALPGFDVKPCGGSREQAEALHVEGVKKVCESMGIALVPVDL